MVPALIILATLWLSYANGANDNVKGVATLIGSRTLTPRSALRFAAVCTFAGSMCTVVLAGSLVKAFGGRGLVPDNLLDGSLFPLAVLVASAATVMLATCLGLPVSTTHAMMGALVGAGVAARFSAVDFPLLGTSFAAPLVFSPTVAILLAAPLYVAFRRLRQRSGLDDESCVCVEAGEGLTVSTTHVSCGALFGIGLTTGQANTRMIAAILCAWITTLPLGMALGMTGYWIGAQFGGL
jgi:PiT family inorganic phosphate transporter